MTMWFTKRPGEICSEAAEDSDEPGTLLMGDVVPDWVRLPADLGADAGRRLRVLSSGQGPCPKCGGAARHLELEDRYGVAECLADAFVFYRRREPTAPA